MSNDTATSLELQKAIISIGEFCAKLNAMFSPEPPQAVEAIPRYVSRNEAAEILQLNVRTIDRKIKEGRLKRYFLGGQVRLLLSDVQALIE